MTRLDIKICFQTSPRGLGYHPLCTFASTLERVHPIAGGTNQSRLSSQGRQGRGGDAWDDNGTTETEPCAELQAQAQSSHRHKCLAKEVWGLSLVVAMPCCGEESISSWNMGYIFSDIGKKKSSFWAYGVSVWSWVYHWLAGNLGKLFNLSKP